MLEDIIIRLEDNFSEYLTDIRENEDKRIANELIRIENERARNEYFAKLIAETKSYWKRMKKVYGTVSENENRFALPDEYTELCMLDVFVNGFCLNQNEYAVDGHDVVLVKPLDVVGTVVEVVVTRNAVITSEDYDNLRGLRGFSAYEVAVQNGFKGSIEEWLWSLNGSGGYERFVSWYKTTSANEKRIKLPSVYTEKHLLDVFVNGFKLSGEEYSVQKVGTEYFLVLATALDVVGTSVEMDVIDAHPSSFVEEDPTVPDYVKNITERDIDNWNGKVNQEIGKGLSTNDFTNEAKAKLEDLDNYNDTEVRQKITAIETEQITQNETIEESTNKITANVREIAKLKEEKVILRSQFPAGEAEGESVTLRDSAEGLEIEGLRIGGNSYQESGNVTNEEGNIIGTKPSMENPSEIEAVKNIELNVCNKNFLDVSKVPDVAGLKAIKGLGNNTYIKIDRGYRFENRYRSIGFKFSNLAMGKEYIVSFDVKVKGYSSDFSSISIVYGLNTYEDSIALSQVYKTKMIDSNVEEKISFSFICKDKENIVAFGVYATSDLMGISIDMTNIQLEEGEKGTQYVEHKSESYTIPVQQEMLKGDYLDLERDEEVHAWGKWVLDGVNKKTTYKHMSIGSDTRGFYAIIVNNKLEEYKSGSPEGVLCTHLITYDNSVYPDVVGQDCIYWQKTGDYLYLSVPFLSVGEVNNWLKEQYEAGTPVTIYYRLKELIRIPFTEEQKQKAEEMRHMRTYKEVTHVDSVAEGVKPILSFCYRKDLQIENEKMKVRLDEIEALLSTASTSALLLDNLENDLKGEVM